MMPRRRPAGSSRSSMPGSTRGRCRRRRLDTPMRPDRSRPSPSRRTSSPRPSTRPGVGSTRCWPSTRWCSGRARTSTWCAWATSSTPTGRKMSKSLGNIIDPWTILDTRGAPTPSVGGCSARARRGPPPEPAWRPSTRPCATCCSRCGTPSASSPPTPRSTISIRPTGRARRRRSGAARPLDPVSPGQHGGHGHRGARDLRAPRRRRPRWPSLVDDLSNWYVRRSRRRFWRTDPDAPAGDSLAAQATLHEVLTTLSLLLAPMCPFVADAMWRALTGAAEDQSVHLADWPKAPVERIDRDLEAQMGLARRLTSLGRAARGEAGVKVRQPLARALVFLPSTAPAILDDIVAEELNVDEIDLADELSEVLEFELVANYRTPRPSTRRTGAAPQAGSGRPRRGRRRRRPRGRTVHHAHPARRAGRAGSRRRAAPGARAAGVRRLPRGGRGRRSRPAPRRRSAPPGAGPRGRPAGAGPAQDQRVEVSDRIHLHLVGLETIAGYFDYIAREVLAVSIAAGPGVGRGNGARSRGRRGLGFRRASLAAAEADELSQVSDD